ncbi:MAG: alpha/beta fold hydrolase, partial [Thermoanaerobaculia bacterium]
ERMEFCRRFWSVLRLLYVVDPANAGRINWGRCDLPNELHFRKYWIESILPSMQELRLEQAAIDRATRPVLTIHGRNDRSAPYGGGREWAMRLPDARLVTVYNAGHAPWIEDAAKVFESIEVFLAGAWPEGAERVVEIDPGRFE